MSKKAFCEERVAITSPKITGGVVGAHRNIDAFDGSSRLAFHRLVSIKGEMILEICRSIPVGFVLKNGEFTGKLPGKRSC